MFQFTARSRVRPIMESLFCDGSFFPEECADWSILEKGLRCRSILAFNKTARRYKENKCEDKNAYDVVLDRSPRVRPDYQVLKESLFIFHLTSQTRGKSIV